jgi:hypothetical protein
MQDENSPSDTHTPASAQVTIPARIVDWLRRAAYTEIGTAAQALDTAAFALDREAHPEWFRGPAEHLRETYALLDAIGWSQTTPPTATPIDPHENCWALMRALVAALEFADEEVNESIRSLEHTERGILPEPYIEHERARALWNFTATLQAHIDTLAVEEGTDTALDLAA